jgi:large subunit ribosomal protein L13
MKTYSAKPTEVTRKWYIIDASQAPLGRIATQVADLLTGKTKPQYTPHIDCGDYVIVINSDQLQVTGKKRDDKIYYHHTGFPGGIKQATLTEKLDKDSRDVVVKAVRGMISANKLRPGRLARLKVYTGSEHNNHAQKPEVIEVKESK